MPAMTEHHGWAAADGAVALLRGLARADDVAGFLATAAELARQELGVDRAVVLDVSPGRVTAADSGALDDHASDVLRRRVLAEPIRVPAGADLGDAPALAALVAAALGLRAAAVGVLAPGGDPLAVLVTDRDDGDPAHPAAVAGFAAVLAVALEHVLLRCRVGVVSGELRHLMASAQALLAELEHAPLALPSRGGPGAVFPWEALTGEGPAPADALLSEREIAICERLVAGRSNREIAADLMLAPDTVKGNVARILRKLGAANRAEAVSRYLTMTSGGQWLTRA